jgi:Na+/proline symporter
MSVYDYIVLVYYLAFTLSIGPVFMKFSKTASDFFRASGMLWWAVGSSVFMTAFSA